MRLWKKYGKHSRRSCASIMMICFPLLRRFNIAHPLRGVSYFPQGKQFLFNALIEKMESNKGLYLNHYQVSSITTNKMIDLEIKATGRHHV